MPWSRLARVSPILGALVGFAIALVLTTLFVVYQAPALEGNKRILVVLFIAFTCGFIPGLLACLLAQIYQKASEARPVPLMNDGWTLLSRSVDAAVAAFVEEADAISNEAVRQRMQSFVRAVQSEQAEFIALAGVGRRIEPHTRVTGPTNPEVLGLWERLVRAHDDFERAADEAQSMRRTLNESRPLDAATIEAKLSEIEASLPRLHPEADQ